MIPATHPHQARFRHQNTRSDGQTNTYFTTKPVIAWDDDGRPLVADKQRLVTADTYSNFHDVVSSEPPVVAVLPGGGWIAEYRDDEGTWPWPVLAWSIDAAGSVTPLFSDSLGDVDVLPSKDLFRLYHPDHEPTDERTETAPAIPNPQASKPAPVDNTPDTKEP